MQPPGKTFCCIATFPLDKTPRVDYIPLTDINSPKEDFPMDPKKVTKQTFDFYKSTFENTYNAMSMLQEQSQKMVEMYLDQTQGFPEEGKKAVQEWIKAYKKGSQDFKSAVDESFKKVEDFFAEAAK
jgi:polyhydroxyalkanoate synthesis regulator phasin